MLKMSSSAHHEGKEAKEGGFCLYPSMETKKLSGCKKFGRK